MPDDNAMAPSDVATYRWVKRLAPYALAAVISVVGASMTLGMAAAEERARLTTVEGEIVRVESRFDEHITPGELRAHPVIMSAARDVRERVHVVELQQATIRADMTDAKGSRRRMERKMDALLIRFGMGDKAVGGSP